jgi:hypothetical protein
MADDVMAVAAIWLNEALLLGMNREQSRDVIDSCASEVPQDEEERDVHL